MNKAVIPAIWYSLYRRPLLVYGCGHALYQATGLYRRYIRKPTFGCNGLLNRHGKRLTPLARIHFRSHAALFDFTDCTIRASTGLLQCLHRATSFVGYPQCEEETAFLRIEGNICFWTSFLLSGPACGFIPPVPRAISLLAGPTIVHFDRPSPASGRYGRCNSHP